MKKKIRTGFMWISAVAILVTAACAMIVYYNILKNQIFADLKTYAHVIEQTDMQRLTSGNTDIHPDGDGLRLTLIDPDGTVIYESSANIQDMDNHSKRPEVMEAAKAGEGMAVRYSSTLSMHTFYYAIRLDDGSVLRVAKDSDSILRVMQNTIGIVAVIVILIFAVCIWISCRLTAKLLEPIEKLATNIVVVDEDKVYEEIRPFVTMIKEQHVNILNHAQLRQEFTANVSHELKTPLTAISGYAELIGNGMAGEADTKRFANEIYQNANRLQELITDILRLSELDSEDFKMDYEPVDLYEVAADCLDSMELQAAKQGITLKLFGESVIISSNKTLMDELVYNLCSNAVRYNKKGGLVTVTVRQKDGRPYLAVEDTGIGIPKEHQQRIFERFYRVDKSHSRSTGGTGLGLAIVKHIVAQHEAKLTLSSEVGKGTRIEVQF